MHAMPLDELRQLMHRDAVAFRGPMAEVGSARDLEVRGATGPLRARLWLPRGVDAPPPLLLYLHGGGMVFGDLDTHESFCRLLCHHGQMAVLAVEYRLAPEHPFPAPLEDCLAAYGWARERAAGLGANPTKVAVGGDSAGGTLSAVIAWLARRDGLPPPLAQLLLYPATDLTRDSASMGLFAEGFLLTREDVRWFTRQYLAGADAADPRVSPLLASDHRGLAPALVVTSGFDPLRDEGEAYAEALRSAGNRVESLRIEGMVHGFIMMAGLSASVHQACVEVGTRFRHLIQDQP
jgi:acetyl esterase